MTAKARTTLKGEFEDGDVPTGSNYSDVFDSFVNLLDSGTQNISGAVNLNSLGASISVSAPTINCLNLNATTVQATRLNATQLVVTTVQATRVAGTRHTPSEYVVYSSNPSVVALGTTFASAQPLGAVQLYVLTEVTAAESGVVLQEPVVGLIQTIVNAGDVTAQVYPASGASLDTNAATTARDVFPNETLTVVHGSSTKYYTSKAS